VGSNRKEWEEWNKKKWTGIWIRGEELKGKE
jgi:hypothetical protein